MDIMVGCDSALEGISIFVPYILLTGFTTLTFPPLESTIVAASTSKFLMHVIVM